MQLKLLLPLAALVLAVPATADAAVTTQITGTTLTLTGDGADDNVVIGVNNAGLLTHNLGGDATDFDATTAGVQTLPSNDTIAVTLNLGAGNDTANLSAANLANGTINGEAGDDIITGGDNVEQISGGDGNDRITGFRGDDVVNGDGGNDTMIWNNGDGTDDNVGGAGEDETLIVTGTAADLMTVKPQGAVTRFDRSNGPFGINMSTVERMSVTSFGGNDSLTTEPGVPVAMRIDPGTGADTITTGDGDDLVIWNNGDGSDVINGQGGVDRVQANLASGNDVSTFKPENGRIRYDRTSAGAFNLSIGTAEFFELNSLGGDDTLTTSPGTIPVIADGGTGNDVFNVRDGVAGPVFGGSGADSAVAAATDATTDVEAVDRPAATPTPQPAPAPGPGAGSIGKSAKVKNGTAAIKIACPAGTSGCTGYVTLLHKSRELGRKPYRLKGGEAKTLKVKVGRKPPKTVRARVSSRAAADKETKLKLVL